MGLETVNAPVGITPVQSKRSMVRPLWVATFTLGAKVKSGAQTVRWDDAGPVRDFASRLSSPAALIACVDRIVSYCRLPRHREQQRAIPAPPRLPSSRHVGSGTPWTTECGAGPPR